MHKHLEQVVPNLEPLRIVFQVCKLCLQFFVNDLRANELMIARPALRDQLIRDHPRLQRREKDQDLSVCLVLDLARAAGTELLVELQDLL